jgi:hypothetical protein
MGMNVRLSDQVATTGLGTLGEIEKDIAAKLDGKTELSQTELIQFQKKISDYSNTISMMSGLLKSLSDSDKGIINNS